MRARPPGKQALRKRTVTMARLTERRCTILHTPVMADWTSSAPSLLRRRTGQAAKWLFTDGSEPKREDSGIDAIGCRLKIGAVARPAFPQVFPESISLALEGRDAFLRACVRHG